MSNSLELLVVKSLFKSSAFEKYSGLVPVKFIEDNSKELFKIFKSIEAFHVQYPQTDIPSCEVLEMYHYVQYPATQEKEKAVVSKLIENLSSLQPDEEIVGDYVRGLSRRESAARLSLLAIEVADGTRDYEELVALSKGLVESSEVASSNEREFVTESIEDIYEKHYAGEGLNWRLRTLNRMLGPLRKGDFGFLFARPETGKTTILASEVTYFATQVDRPIIWFNNEQPGGVVRSRVYQAYFGVTTDELFKNRQKYQALYQETLGGRIKIYDSGSISRRDVERVCNQYNPSVILFDQIDKIKGFSDDRNDLELKAIYQWARELAKQYGPTIGVCQASGSAEGKRYLTMDDVDSSKTAKQGEADWILGIGRSNNEGMEAIRHFHLCKNKLIGGVDTLPELRHGKCDVRIRPEISRYEDLK